MDDEHGLVQFWNGMALTRLAQSFKLAVGPAKVLIALAAVILICIVGVLMDLCSRSVVVDPARNVPQALFTSKPGSFLRGSELEIFIEKPAQTAPFIKLNKGKIPGQGVFATLWSFSVSRFNNAAAELLRLDNANIFANTSNAMYNLWQGLKAIVWAVRFHTIYSLIFFSFTFLVVCFAGGAICRCAALEFSGNEKPDMLEACRFSLEKIKSLLAAPLIPLMLTALFALLIVLAGFVANIPWLGELLIAPSLGLILPAGLAVTLLAVVSIVGAGLLFPAIAYEGTTGLDAIGRAFSYILGKPLWTSFYLFVAAVLGTAFYMFIRLLLFAVLWVTYALLAVGVFNNPAGPDKLQRIWARPGIFNLLSSPAGPANWSEYLAAAIINIIMLFFVALVLALVISFACSVMTVIYALLRRKIDNVHLNQVFVHLETIRHKETE